MFFKKINQCFLNLVLSFFLGCGSYLPADTSNPQSSDDSDQTLSPPEDLKQNSDENSEYEKTVHSNAKQDLKGLQGVSKAEFLGTSQSFYPEEAVFKVFFLNEEEGVSYLGTGFLISEDLLVTALHTIENLTNMDQVYFVQEGLEFFNFENFEKLEAVSLYSDLAIFRLRRKYSYFLKRGQISLDEPVFLIGYPEGSFEHLQSYSPPTKDEIGLKFYSANFKFEGKSFRGSSGGPILNSQGEFIGVNLRGREESSLFFPAEYVQKLLNGEVGRKCDDIMCIQEEEKMVQNHIEEYANNEQDIPLISETFFHVDIDKLLELTHKDNVINYFLKGVLQEALFFKDFHKLLIHLEMKAVHDSDTTLSWIQKAGHKGVLPAQYYLSGMYLFGIGVEKNYDQYFYWLKKQAHQGSFVAQFSLGISYITGFRVEQNLERGRYWIRKVAEQNSNIELREEAIKLLNQINFI